MFAADTESSTFSKSSTGQTQKTKKDAHTEQTLKDWDLSWVGRSCEILLQQKGAIIYCLFGLQSLKLRWVINICTNFFIARDTCWGNIFLFLPFARLKFHISTFITISEYVLSFSFHSQYFEAFKGYHKVCIEILKQRTTLHLLFVGH